MGTTNDGQLSYWTRTTEHTTTTTTTEQPDNANFRKDTHRQVDHPRRRLHGHSRGCEGKDPREGGHPPRPAASHLRGQAARGWPYPSGLQHPEEVHSQDALEVEEEAYASPPEEAPQDASTLQVSLRRSKQCRLVH